MKLTDEQKMTSGMELCWEFNVEGEPENVWRVLSIREKLHRKLRFSEWFGSEQEAIERAERITANGDEVISVRCYRMSH